MKRKMCNLLSAVVAGSMVFAPVVSYASEAGNSSGPTTKVVNGPYTWHHAKTGGGGGYIPAIIFNQSEKDLIYVRTDMGGAYRWNPETKSWIGLSDWISAEDWNDLGCESLATDPIETNRVYILAGTYTNDWTSSNGSILRSTDKGDTWEKIELPFKVGGNMPGRGMGERLMIDPVANNVLYLGARNGNGLWRSTDYGSTWSKVESFTATGDYVDDYFNDGIGVVWEAFDPTSAPEGTNADGTKKPCQTIYVGVADKTESIYVTHDGGETWAPVEGQPTVDNQDSWVKQDSTTKEYNPRAFLPVHGVLASNGQLYITYSNDCGPYDGTKGDVFRYDTKTGEWKNISPEPSSDYDNNYSGYGGLGVDAQNPNTLVVSAMNSWWPDTKFWRSTDGGETWSPIWNWEGYPTRTLRYNLDISNAPWLKFDGKSSYPEPCPKLGWMTTGVAIDPFDSDRMMYGTGATLYGTNNLTDWGSDKKVDISVMANGIEETNVQCVISSGYKGTSAITGEADVAGFVYGEDLQENPKAMHTPTWNTESMDFAEEQNNFMVRVGSQDLGKDPNGKSIAFTYDGGNNWFTGGTYINGDTSMKGGTVAVNTKGEKIVWAPSGKEAYFTTDKAATWTKCEGLPAGAKVASDRVNADKFYAMVNGDFYVSEDGAKTFTKTATGFDSNAKFKAVMGQEGNIWIASKNGMYVSRDSGATFTKNEGLDSAETVGFGKAKDGSDYAAIYTHAKANGVDAFYRSDDAGKTWVRINDDKNQYGAANNDISGDPEIYGRVYIATNGLGLVYGDIKEEQGPTYGDVNGDGTIDVSDYTIFRKYINAGMQGITINEENADVNKDGTVDFFDLVALKALI